MFSGKKVILGITGSIAAYKSAYLVRGLIKEGAEVQVIMTPSASNFITPLTLSTLSKREVIVDFFDENASKWNDHVDLGRWADLFLIAPASANTIAKMANGMCEDMLSATYLSATCPVLLAPAMDLEMYRHPSTQANINQLIAWGNEMISPEDGELASGLYGVGRMAEPSRILEFLDIRLKQPETNGPLHGKKVLVTAGPTEERIDPVRFLSNHSSGKMGYALAHAAAANGAEVTLVSGPVALETAHPSIHLIRVKSAEEMSDACSRMFPECDLTLMAAAVADMRPVKVSKNKIKKGSAGDVLELEKTPDILSNLGKVKRQDQVLVGFALETDDEEENAQKKLKKKGLDLIVLNSLRDEGAGFGHDTNKVTLFDLNNNKESLPLDDKSAIAQHIVKKAVALMEK